MTSEDETMKNQGKIIKRKRRTGEWLRLTDLSEEDDDRYKCSRCGYIVHQSPRSYLWEYNNYCGHCGSCNNPFMNKYEIDFE